MCAALIPAQCCLLPSRCAGGCALVTQEERTAAKVAKLKELQTSLADTQPVGSLIVASKNNGPSPRHPHLCRG